MFLDNYIYILCLISISLYIYVYILFSYVHLLYIYISYMYILQIYMLIIYLLFSTYIILQNCKTAYWLSWYIMSKHCISTFYIFLHTMYLFNSLSPSLSSHHVYMQISVHSYTYSWRSAHSIFAYTSVISFLHI